MADRKALYRDPTSGQVSEVLPTDQVGNADAVAIQAIPVSASAPGHAGEILIYSGTEWVPGDPLVQGVYPPTTRTDTGGISGGPINPVLVGGSDYNGATPELQNLKVDSSGNIYIGNSSFAVTGTVAVSGVGGIVEVAPTGSANTKANPFFFALSDGTNVITAALSAWGTAPTGTYVQGVNAELFQGSAAVGSGNPLYVQGSVTASIGSGPYSVTGTLTDNNAAPSTNNVGALTALATFNRPGKTQGNLTLLSVDLDGALRTHQRAESVLGDIVTGFRYNQIEIDFSFAFNSALITNTVTAGGTVAPSQANGCATYATGAASSKECTGTSVQALEYRPGHEWYCYFTAAFTAGAAGSHQRTGPYNGTDGFWIGYEGTVFGVTQYQNSALVGGTANVAPTVARSAFNGDQLMGATNSPFTSGGVPVAIDFTKINIFRVHGAWFGTAPVTLEVFAPDGVWVPMHTFRFPNTLTTPYAYSTNWNLQIDVANTTNATNIAMVTACWAMGCCDNNVKISDAINDYTLTSLHRAVLAGKMPSGTYGNVGLTPDSALTVGGSGDTNVAAATWTSTTGSLVAPVGGAKNDETAGATTLSVVYSPTTGNTVVVTFNTGAAYTGLGVKDSSGNSLTAGPTIGQLAMFYQSPVPSGITGYTATWTTSRQATMAVEEYSGVNAVDAALTGNTASATSATASITVTPDELGDIVVCGLSNQATETMTGTVGNTRQNVTGGATCPMVLMDTTASPATCTATLTSTAWDAAAIGLRPTIVAGTALNTALVMVNNSFAYNSVTVELVGSGTILAGAITFEVSIDNSHWVGLIGVNINTGLAMTSGVFTLTSATTCLGFNVTGFNYFRARLSTQIAGYGGQVVISYNVQGLATPSVTTNISTGAITVNGNQGSPNTPANAWPVIPTDGSQNQITIKPASTASVATDTALVVQLSPNQPALTTALNIQGTATVSIAAAQTLATVTTVGAVTAITDALPAGTNTLGGTVPTAVAAGGGILTNIQQALTASASVKGSAGSVYGYSFYNPNAAVVYLFFYNASPTIGSTSGLFYQIGIPAGLSGHIAFPQGIPCGASAIYVAVSTSPTSAAAPSTGCVVTTLYA